MNYIKFINACMIGNLFNVKKYYGNFNITDGFNMACIKGYLEIAQWLYLSNGNIYPSDKYLFIIVCQHGHLEVAQWLISICIDIYNDNYILREAFFLSCRDEKKNIVQWLWDLELDIGLIYLDIIPSDKILQDIFKLNEKEIRLFKGIIEGNKEKIKESIKEGADYDILDHFAFKKSCNENRINIIKYLSKINPDYYYELDKESKIINYEIINYPKNARFSS